MKRPAEKARALATREGFARALDAVVAHLDAVARSAARAAASARLERLAEVALALGDILRKEEAKDGANAKKAKEDARARRTRVRAGGWRAGALATGAPPPRARRGAAALPAAPRPPTFSDTSRRRSRRSRGPAAGGRGAPEPEGRGARAKRRRGAKRAFARTNATATTSSRRRSPRRPRGWWLWTPRWTPPRARLRRARRGRTPRTARSSRGRWSYSSNRRARACGRARGAGAGAGGGGGVEREVRPCASGRQSRGDPGGDPRVRSRVRDRRGGDRGGEACTRARAREETGARVKTRRRTVYVIEKMRSAILHQSHQLHSHSQTDNVNFVSHISRIQLGFAGGSRQSARRGVRTAERDRGCRARARLLCLGRCPPRLSTPARRGW